MAVPHFSAQELSRGKGDSAVGASAYRARAEILDERTGEIYDYSRHPSRCVFEGIYAPKNAPDWARDRSQLWNHVEAFEKHKRAILAQEINIALPHELTLEQQRYLLQDWIKENVTRKGLIADAVIHVMPEGQTRNDHAHVMIVTRKLDGTEFQAAKDRFATYSEKDAARKADLLAMRQSWEKLANRHLERHGHEARIDMSRKQDGEATLHLGKTAAAMERRGEASEIGDYNRKIAAENERRRQKTEIVTTLEAIRQRDAQAEKSRTAATDARHMLEDLARTDPIGTAQRYGFHLGDRLADPAQLRAQAAQAASNENQAELTRAAEQQTRTRKLEAEARAVAEQEAAQAAEQAKAKKRDDDARRMDEILARQAERFKEQDRDRAAQEIEQPDLAPTRRRAITRDEPELTPEPEPVKAAPTPAPKPDFFQATLRAIRGSRAKALEPAPMQEPAREAPPQARSMSPDKPVFFRTMAETQSPAKAQEPAPEPAKAATPPQQPAQQIEKRRAIPDPPLGLFMQEDRDRRAKEIEQQPAERERTPSIPPRTEDPAPARGYRSWDQMLRALADEEAAQKAAQGPQRGRGLYQQPTTETPTSAPENARIGGMRDLLASAWDKLTGLVTRLDTAFSRLMEREPAMKALPPPAPTPEPAAPTRRRSIWDDDLRDAEKAAEHLRRQLERPGQHDHTRERTR